MTIAITDQKKWRQLRRQQGQANAERWLKLIEAHHQPADFVIREYDNLLRALEYTLESPETFNLAYRLIQTLFVDAFGFADWDRWLFYLEQALVISHELGCAEEQAGLLELMGDVHRNQGLLEDANTKYLKAKSIFEQLSQTPRQASLLSKMALFYDAQGQDGLDLCQEALGLAKGTQDTEAIALAEINLSAIYVRKRDWPAALKAARTARTLFQKLQKPQLEMRAFFNIITCWGEMGQWSKVVKAANQLADELNKKGDTHTLAKLRNNLGVIAAKQELWGEAERHWQEALKLHSMLQNPQEQAFLYNNLGVVYTKMGEYETAEEMLLQTIKIQEALGDIYNWANSSDNLADLYVEKGATAVAQQTRQHAMAKLQTIEPSPHVQQLLAAMQMKLDTT